MLKVVTFLARSLADGKLSVDEFIEFLTLLFTIPNE